MITTQRILQVCDHYVTVSTFYYAYKRQKYALSYHSSINQSNAVRLS